MIGDGFPIHLGEERREALRRAGSWEEREGEQPFETGQQSIT